MRNFLFFQFLGGSAASALTNLTQVPMVTVPYLTQFSAKAPALLIKWMSGRKPTDQAHLRALTQAKEEGIVSPQEIYNLMATARGGRLGTGKVMQRQLVQTALYAWGAMFSMAEQYNRNVTFNAAYELARSKGYQDPYAFAKEAVEETQFVYAKHNRPMWARGLGAPLFTFKQFLINYIEFVGRLPVKQKAIALSLLWLAAGAEGLPFEEDLEDLLDAIGQAAGFPTNSRKALEDWAIETLGSTFGNIFLKGVSGIPDMPIDIQSRLSLGNLIPGTRMLVPSNQNKGRDVAELLGPAGSLVESAGYAAEKAVRGEFDKAGEALAPRAVQHAIKGLQMFDTGEYRDREGRKVADVGKVEAAFKTIGIHPTKVSRIQKAKWMLMKQRNMHRLKKDAIADKWAQGVFENNPEMVRDARNELAKWNRNNRELRIKISKGSIQRRLKEKRLTAQDRFLRHMPKELRAQAIDYFD